MTSTADSDTALAKKALRKQIRQLKSCHTAEQLAAMSEQVESRLMETSYWQQSRNILLYSALPDEVDTKILLLAACREGKNVWLPVVVGDNLILRSYQSTTPMHKGAFGIAEPQGEQLTDLTVIDLAIIPGMAFTSDGVRLGRGKGYYDRLLPRLTKATHIGLCFPFQLVDNIPSESHDQLMDDVIFSTRTQASLSPALQPPD
ncbi:MAG: 5-formyltetrahydrofolate cyclo-ligase [Bacteroidaceae bacterium]|nr:5-formyltetrahydrofolate cyclo-ligase [Bacteroidaceae bacterium]